MLTILTGYPLRAPTVNSIFTCDSLGAAYALATPKEGGNVIEASRQTFFSRFAGCFTWLLESPRALGRTIEGRMTTERAARCVAVLAAFVQHAKYYRSKAPFHHRRVVFQATVVGALTFGLEVAPLTEVDIRILNGCLAALKILGSPSVPLRTRTQSRYRKSDAGG